MVKSPAQRIQDIKRRDPGYYVWFRWGNFRLGYGPDQGFRYVGGGHPSGTYGREEMFIHGGQMQNRNGTYRYTSGCIKTRNGFLRYLAEFVKVSERGGKKGRMLRFTYRRNDNHVPWYWR